MKTTLLILLVFLCPLYLLANRIDSLKTDKDVELFITSIDSNIQKYHVTGNDDFRVIPRAELINYAQTQHLPGLNKIQSWQKLDVNQDGKTDLIVHGRWFNKAVFVVMDTGHGSYKAYRLRPHEGSTGEAQIALPVYSNKSFFLVLYGQCCKNTSVGQCIDTLVYHDQAFVEYEAHAVKYNMSSVTFTAYGCPMGQCQAYKIKVNADKSAKYIASSFIPRQGIYTAMLSQPEFGRLIGLLQYIHVKKMSHLFEDCGVFDASQWGLEVVFQDGSSTKFRISADQAPYGLLAVEDLFSALRQNQTWTKIK